MKIKNKIQVAFFLVLIAYLAILGSGAYISVYYTYISIPVLVLLGLLAFGNYRSIHKTAKIIFLLSFVLAIATVASVQYVGVYLVYIVVPILVISGIITMITSNEVTK